MEALKIAAVFLVGYVVLALLYMNPLVRGVYQKAQRKGIKKWKEVWKPLTLHAVSTLSIATAVVVLATKLSLWEVVGIGLLLRLIPRALETFTQYELNNEIICIELINGTIGLAVMSYLAFLL